MCQNDEMNEVQCCDCQSDFCPCCEELLIGDSFHLELTDAKKHGTDLLDFIQDRLEAARRLEQAGWTIRPTPQGLSCVERCRSHPGHRRFAERTGERIAQLVPAAVTLGAFDEVDDLDETERGHGR